MPSSDDKPDEPDQPLRGKLRKRSAASSREAEEVGIGKMWNHFENLASGSVFNISRESLNKLIAKGQLHLSASPNDSSKAVIQFEKNPALVEALEGWIGEDTLFGWLDQMRGETHVSRFDFAVAVASLMCLRWIEVDEAEARAILEFEEGGFFELKEPLNLLEHWSSSDWRNQRFDLGDELLRNLERASAGDASSYAPRLKPGLQIFSRIERPMQDALIQRILMLDPTTSSGRRLGRMLIHSLLKWLVKREKGSAGEFHTPEPLIELMVGLADPNPGERVYDPCFGTGSLLAAAARRKIDKTSGTDTNTWGQIRRNGIYGREINPLVFILGLARIVYSGVDLPRLEVGNSLEVEPFNGESGSGYDCILSNPPFGTRTREYQPHLYPFPMPDGDGLFLQHIVHSLRPGGRAVVLMPQGVLFRGGRMKELRRYLVEQNFLKQVIALPDGVLKPYTMASVNLLVLERSEIISPVRFLNLRQVDLPIAPLGKFDALAQIKGATSYELTHEELAGRDWDLVVREEVTEELTNEIEELASLYPDVELAPLGKVAEIKRGIPYRRAQTTENLEEAGEDGIRLIRISDLRKGEILRSQLFLRPEVFESLPHDAFLRSGDIVLSINGTIGKLAVYTGKERVAVASSGIVLIRSKHRGLSPEYLFSLLNSEAYQRLLSSVSRGAAIQSLPVAVLNKLEIPLPPIPTQNQVARHANEHHGDGFAFLRRVLAKAEEDPFITWLDESDEIEAVIVSAKENIERDRLITIQRAAASIRRIRNQLAHGVSSASVSTEQLFGWLNMLSDSAAKLTSIVSLNDLAERFNLLHNAAVQAMASTFLIPDEQSSLGKRASMLTRSLQRLLEREVAVINAQQRIEILCDDEVSPDVISEVSMTIINHGPLPLRDIEIRDSHSAEPGDFISYLAANDSRRFMIRMFTADVESDDGMFFTDLIVTGTRMNDERFEFDESVSVRINEQRDFENIQQDELNVDAGIRLFDTPPLRRMDLLGETTHGFPRLPEEHEATDYFRKSAPSSFADESEEIGAAPGTDLGYSPYTAGTPVPRKMFGREATLNRITRQISTKGEANVILLEGNRRTGKTSLLERLDMGDLTPDCVVVYVDCQEGDSSESKPGLPTAEVWRSIAMAVSERLIASGYRSPDFSGEDWVVTFDGEKLNSASRNAFDSDHPYETFKRFLTRAVEEISPRRLVLMLDEFDKLQEGVENGITSPSVFQNIRHLVHTHSDLSLILAGTPLLKHLREQHWSALYGFGISVKVSFLSEADARCLITEPVAGVLRYSEAAIERLIEATNGQPYLLQSLCNAVFLDLAEEGTRQTVSIKDVDKTIQEMAETGGHFRDLWNFAGTERRRLLLAMAQRKSRSGGLLSRSTILEELADYGVSVPKNERIGTDLEYLRDLELLKLNKHSSSQHYTLLVPLFGEWIEENEDFEDVVERAVIESEHNLR